MNGAGRLTRPSGFRNDGMSWKPGEQVFEFEGRKFTPGQTYTWDDLPEEVRDDVVKQVQSWSEEDVPEEGPRFRFEFIPQEELMASLDEHHGPRLTEYIEEPHVLKLAKDIGKKGLKSPPVGDEGQHRLLALARIGKGAPYFSFEGMSEEEEMGSPELGSPARPKVPPKLAKRGLLVTPQHVSQMVGNKAIGLVPIRCEDFLSLTTSSRTVAESIIAEAKWLDDYNRYAKEGSNILPPFLKVSMDTGKIEGHEGRHRAAALCREMAGSEMWVAIIVTNKDGKALYYIEEGPWPFKKTYLGVESLPEELTGEFRDDVVVKLDKSKFWPIQG